MKIKKTNIGKIKLFVYGVCFFSTEQIINFLHPFQKL